MPRAKAAALRALQIDDRLAEGHASLGMVVFYYDWNWPVAERELGRALELNPGYATGRYWHAVFLADLGRREESIREMRRALELDPLSVRTRCDLGWTLFFARRYGEAIEQLRKALEMDPGFPMTHHILGEAYAESGQFEEAISQLQKAQAPGPGSHFKAMLGYAHARAGHEAEARRILSLLELRPERWTDALDLATLRGALGDRDEAFLLLERAFVHRHPRLVRLAVEPWWDCLRDDPRFDDLLRRMKLPPGWGVADLARPDPRPGPTR
jgi:tetratricopeptide (TPR) repeat protein